MITGLDQGGAERSLVNVVTSADSGRIASDVVSLIEPGSKACELRAAGIPVTSLGMRRGYPSIGGLTALIGHLRRTRPAILQTWLYHADLLGYLASQFLPDTRLVWNLRCSDIATAPDQFALRRLVQILARLSTRPDAVVVNSSAGKLFHQNRGYRPQTWIEIVNGVDARRFLPRRAERTQLRGRLGLTPESRVIGLVARRHSMKDHRTFLNAAALFSSRDPDARFVLCGNGCGPESELKLVIESLDLSNRVFLLGARADMENIYPAFDILALSSAYGEGFPNVLIEAMACAVPCVATNVGDSQEIVGDTGVIVPPRDPQALANGWEKMLDGPTSSRGEKARLRVVKRYHVDRARARYQELYEDLAQDLAIEDTVLGGWRQAPSARSDQVGL